MGARQPQQAAGAQLCPQCQQTWRRGCFRGGRQGEMEAELLGRKASVYLFGLVVEWCQLAAFRNLHEALLILAFVLACP